MFQLKSPDLAIDLGTANTLICEQGGAVILNEPSVVAIRTKNGRREPFAFGAEAKAIIGRAPEGVEVIRPVRSGVIANFDAAGLMLNHFISSVRKRNQAILRPRVAIGVPSGVTEVEKRILRESVERLAREVRLIDEAMAAAIGCNLPVHEAHGCLMVDIGGGTTDIAIISLSEIVYSLSLKRGGDAMDEAILNHIRRTHYLAVGESTAERIKMTIGSAHPDYDEMEMEVRGRSLVTSRPTSVIVTGAEIRAALSEVVNGIAAGIRVALENTPPELGGDIMTRGIFLSGGGALLRGLDAFLSYKLGVEVQVADDPLLSVAEGAGRCLGREGEAAKLGKVWIEH
jgi:rod shape-determining protein MreB and related proteins